MEVADAHRAFADGRCHALHRMGADVACCEDAGAAGLERIRRPTEEGPGAIVDVIRAEVGPGEHEAFFVEGSWPS